MTHIAIFGPTAVGKSKLSISLAKELGAEIISADSMQIYKYLDIGSAKLTYEQMEGISHHMMSFLEPCEEFDVSQFAKMSNVIIKELESKNKIAIVVGGTGLYIKALTEGLVDLPIDKDLRERLAKEDPQFLHDRLREIDWDYALKIPPNSQRRVIRALEVFELTGKPISYMHKFTKSEFDFHKFALIRDRAKLYEIIEQRVDQMFELGLLSEAKKVYESFTNIQGIGYQELFKYFRGEYSLAEAKEEIKKNSKNYAKRQITWIKSNDYDCINVDEIDPFEYILEVCRKKCQ